MKITIATIPHGKQRYPTVGDWYFRNGKLHIRVSDLGDWRMEMLIAVHELVETLLCVHDGVTQGDVDAFDRKFERDRKPGDEREPGDDPSAPYRRQHQVATHMERHLAAKLGVKWEQYERKLSSVVNSFVVPPSGGSGPRKRGTPNK